MTELLSPLSEQDLLDTLAPATRDAVAALLSGGVDPTAAAVTLATQPAIGLAPKGGTGWPDDLVPRIKKELHVLMCTDDARYAALRAELRSKGDVTAAVLTAWASAAVAAAVGVQAAMCMPFVALLLIAGLRVAGGVACEAWK